jgi:hypothetical protein
VQKLRRLGFKPQDSGPIRKGFSKVEGYFCETRKTRGLLSKTAGAARVDRCRSGRVRSGPSDLDPTAKSAHTRASGGVEQDAAAGDDSSDRWRRRNPRVQLGRRRWSARVLGEGAVRARRGPLNRQRGAPRRAVKAAQQGTRHRAGVGLGSDAVRPEEGDDGRGPPVSLCGAAAHSRLSWAAVSWAAAQMGCGASGLRCMWAAGQTRGKGGGG